MQKTCRIGMSASFGLLCQLEVAFSMESSLLDSMKIRLERTFHDITLIYLEFALL